jgi:anti-anti-sigma factor
MKATLRERNGVTVISLEGVIDYETTNRLRNSLKNIVDNNLSQGRKILINMEKLNFVGSIGVTDFVQVMRDFNSDSNIRYCSVKSEFKKLIRAYNNPEQESEIFDNEDSGINSFDI